VRARAEGRGAGRDERWGAAVRPGEIGNLEHRSLSATARAGAGRWRSGCPKTRFAANPKRTSRDTHCRRSHHQRGVRISGARISIIQVGEGPLGEIVRIGPPSTTAVYHPGERCLAEIFRNPASSFCTRMMIISGKRNDRASRKPRSLVVMVVPAPTRPRTFPAALSGRLGSAWLRWPAGFDGGSEGPLPAWTGGASRGSRQIPEGVPDIEEPSIVIIF